MNVMTATPVTPNPMQQNEEQRVVEEVVDIPRQQDAGPASEPDGEGSPEPVAETDRGDDFAKEQNATEAKEAAEEKEPAEEREPAENKVEEAEKEEKEEKDEKKSAAKPKRKSAPRKAAGGTKNLVVLKEGRVQYADAEAVLVVDLDEASSPDTDVHDVLDRLTELRDAVESPGKLDAVKALTELIQEKALG